MTRRLGDALGSRGSFFLLFPQLIGTTGVSREEPRNNSDLRLSQILTRTIAIIHRYWPKSCSAEWHDCSGAELENPQTQFEVKRCVVAVAVVVRFLALLAASFLLGNRQCARSVVVTPLTKKHVDGQTVKQIDVSAAATYDGFFAQRTTPVDASVPFCDVNTNRNGMPDAE